MTTRSAIGLTALVLSLPVAVGCGGKEIESAMTRAEAAATRSEDAMRRAESSVTRAEQAAQRAEAAIAHVESRHWRK